MKMLNGELQGLYLFLLGIELSGKQSRMRTRFCKMIADRIQESETGRFEIVKKYVNTDEKGEPKIKEIEGQEGQFVYDIPFHNMESFNLECAEILREEFVMIENEERIEMLRAVRNVILDTDVKFSGADAIRYNRWCEVFETIN